MADVIRKATNKFTKGLVMDFSPENTQKEVLTHALNATLLTFNGNELSLQNDMGNGRVETAFLPDGYMPVGTCEYGGIIYIVSYNPLEDKSQIGCFPSPERNISSDELGISEVKLHPSEFQMFKDGKPTGDLNNTSKYVLLRNDNLNPGDKFLIHSDPELYNEALVDLQKSKNGGIYQDVPNPIIALNVVSIEDSGRIVYLNSDLRQYEVKLGQIGNKYHILGENTKSGPSGAIDIDSYRNVLSSGYNVFKSKTSGKLAILAELVTVDSYSVTHSVVPKKITVEGVTQNHEGHYDVIIHTDVTPQVTVNNFNTVPKLSYYHLENSQGYLQKADGSVKLFSDAGYLNDRFLSTNLDEVLTPTESNPINLDQAVSYTGKFNFPRKNTYHGRMEEHSGFITEYEGKDIYTKFTEDKYHRVHSSQLLEANGRTLKSYFVRDLQAKVYRYDPKNAGYTKVESNTLDPDKVYYVSTVGYTYHDVKRDTQYKNSRLYKNVSEYVVATYEVLEDPSIEKYQEKKIYTGYPATSEDLANWEIVDLYIKTSDGYKQHPNAPESGVDYYTVEIDTVMEAIPDYNANPSKYSGIIYYCPGHKIYIEASQLDLRKYWDVETYPTAPLILYRQETIDTYKLATEYEMLNFVQESITLYYKDDYVLIPDDKTAGLYKDVPWFVVVPMDAYVLKSEFEPNTSYNYIQGCTKPTGSNEPTDGYPKDDPIVLCTVADYVPVIYTNGGEQVVDQYPDLKLAGIKIPGILTAYGLDLPFKYSYTITPCMNYGKLKHLSISNTVDFSNLHAFEQSNFNEWRYHIDGNQLRLTFGAEVFDTHEDNKADGLVLEFYDLWGFAGSLEINNKKSYSGTFTKLIQLNTVGSLSKNKINGNSYNTSYKRNVNIYQETVGGELQHKYNGKQVQWDDSGINGWYSLDDIDNDCGVVYSNLIYGVKAYIRRTTEMGIEFIHKKDYFLFTLPIYNDYYYTISDFNNLTNPKLEMHLTYKLEDSSTKLPYNNSDNEIVNGYDNSDFTTIEQFTSGNTAANSLNVTKYYQYKGTSNLYLEVGLREWYKDINLRYDPAINEIFNYRLKLVGEEANQDLYTIKSQVNSMLSTKDILAYRHTDGELPLSINSFGFTTNHNSEERGSNLMNKRFITYPGSDPVTIDYNFVVGYAVQMSNIVRKEFPVTTICALCHKSGDDFNYGDFNIVKGNDSSGVMRHLHNGIIYNTGTRTQRKYGVAIQESLTGNAATQIKSITENFTEEGKQMDAGQANSGEAMRKMLPKIGKLSFCQPHAHAIADGEGVSIHGNCRGAENRFTSGHNYHIIPPDYGGMHLHNPGGTYDNTYGSIPVTRWFDSPLYNLVLNTENAIKNQSEFVSTIKYDPINTYALYAHTGDGWMQWKSCGDAKKFVGLTGAQLESFNSKLITTMQNVYGYNPDYTTYSALDGNTNINDLNVKVCSNIINDYSEFKFKEDKSLNDYIYLGNVSITDYLLSLNKLSNIKVKKKLPDSTKEVWLETLQFIPDTTYCGTQKSPYLITSLTYNFIGDSQMLEDFATANVTTVVKDSNGNLHPIKGEFNRNSLYGYYNEDGMNCLYLLDVANYTIDSDGVVHPRDVSKLKQNSIVNTSKTYSWYTKSTRGYFVKSIYSDSVIRGTSLTINDLIYNPTEEHRLYVRNGSHQYDSALRSKLFYGVTDIDLILYERDFWGNRKEGGWTSWGNDGGDWNMSHVEKNVMFLANGPCFDPDNL